jgi:hypothetical protein
MTPSSPGGNPGRGRVTALALQQVGAKVVVTGCDREHNAAVAAELRDCRGVLIVLGVGERRPDSDSSLDLHAATPWLFFVAFKDATASRWSHSPALQVHPRTAPQHPHWEAMGQTTRTLSGDYVGGG